jgi:hypothetical protein
MLVDKFVQVTVMPLVAGAVIAATGVVDAAGAVLNTVVVPADGVEAGRP